MSRKLHAIIAAVTLVFGLVIFSYDGFGIHWVRNYGGDFLIVFFLYSCLSVVWRGSVARRAAVVFGFCMLTEFVQYSGKLRWFAIEHGAYGHLFLGTTFDWADLFTYALATLSIFAIEKYNAKRLKLLFGTVHH